MTRVVRDCTHPKVHHEHGTKLGYVRDCCRCAPCTTANTAAERIRRRAQLYGRYNGLTDAEPARQHVHALMAAGVGLKQITRVSGVSGGMLTKLIYGWNRDDGTKRPPAKRIKPETSARILAIPVTAVAAGQRVDGTGTHRRLQALVAIGWSQSILARRLGMHPANFGKTMRGDRVLAGTARAVAEMFEQMWNVKPAEAGHREKISASRARGQAVLNGWLPPLAWDDDIDDPAAVPAAGEDAGVDEVKVQRAIDGQPVVLTSAERAEAIYLLHVRGASDSQIGKQLAMSTAAVHAHRQRQMPETVQRRERTDAAA